MLETLKTNTAAALFLSVVSSLVLFIPLLFVAQNTDVQHLNGGLLVGIVSSIPLWGQYTISIVGYLIAVWYANYVINKHQLLGRGNQLSGFFVAFLLAIGPSLLLDNLLGISILLIIRLFDRCFEIQKSTRPNHLLFDATFITTILTLFYTPFIALLLIVWMAAIYSGHFGIKGWLLTIFTLLITTYIVIGILYLFNVPFQPPLNPVTFQLSLPSTTGYRIIYYLLIALVVIAMPTVFSVLRFSKVIIRNHINFSIRSIPIFLLIFLTTSINPLGLFSFLFFPLAIILAQFFLTVKKKRIANIGIILITILVVAFQLFRILEPNYF
ncbi:MAG: hypothetical protein CL840_07960 [Crocinitomicaceae bacterium]|nr:hypothetical protein [Crocinitomicaceae bacterium]|tara:strand:+ start:9733 stop:10710 length:978 start_codon:yes stop_codon:yes gene_type:complete